MSGSQVSSFYPVNQLLADNAQQITNYYAPRRNELLIQKGEQEISSNEMEVAARLAQGLLALPDEAAMAAAYPNAVAYGQGLGFLKNAPSVFPGKARLQQIASYGIPAEKQFERQQNIATNRALIGDGTGTGATTAAPGGGGGAAGTYEGAIGGHEGTGRNPRSTAYGTGQFLESTWLDFAAENPEMFPGMSQQQILAARSNPALGNTAINWLAQKNAQDLQGAGVTPSGQSLGISHYLGSGAAAKIMQAGDTEPVRNFVSDAAVRANPELANMTVGQMKARYAATPNPSFMTAGATPGGQTPAPYQTASLTPTPPPSGATPAAPAPPAATTTAQGATPAQQPPAAPLPDPNRFTPEQQQQLRAMVGRPTSEVTAVMNQFRDENRAAYNTAYQRQQDAEDRVLRLREDKRREAEARRAGLPVGYTLDDNGKAVRIDGLPPDPAVLEAQAKAGQLAKQQFDQENTLRDEFQKLTGDFRIVQTSYENIRSAAKANDGAGDMSLLYNYVRLLDPTSVVRESEFAAAAASGSFGERVQGAVQRVLSGARMPETLRESFIREGRNLYDNQLRSHNDIADKYETLAKRNGLEPDRVVTRFNRPQGDEVAIPPASLLKEGVVTEFANGQRWTLKGGQPAQVK